MINLNNYIAEAWSDEMLIENYIINDKGEIDVEGVGGVWLNNKDFKELPYKFGKVDSYFSLSGNKNLTSLKNCPDYVGDSFDVDYCSKLDSLKGCPKEVKRNFCCVNCKREFTKEEVQKHCNVKNKIYL